MRLNFAGVPDEDIREGIRRIGKVVREQLGLYGTLSGAPAERAREEAPASQSAAQADPRQASELADVVELPRRDRDVRLRKDR
jgi:2-aminoadipate transaminase